MKPYCLWMVSGTFWFDTFSVTLWIIHFSTGTMNLHGPPANGLPSVSGDTTNFRIAHLKVSYYFLFDWICLYKSHMLCKYGQPERFHHVLFKGTRSRRRILYKFFLVKNLYLNGAT